MAAINVAAITQAAIKYQSDIRTLPYAVLGDVLTALKINQLEVANKDVLKQFARKGGVAKPYSASASLVNSDLGKFSERTLEVLKSYSSIKDHVDNYKDKIILNDINSTKLDNKTKKHPLELMVTVNHTRTFSEDIIDALFHAERDEEDLSPLGCFDGYNTLLNKDVAAGLISAGLGNMVATGAIIAPATTNDLDALNKLIAFLRSSRSTFKTQKALLYAPYKVITAAKDCLENKFPTKDITYNNFMEYVLDKADIQNLEIIRHTCLGTGDRMILTVPGNLDFGMNTKGDESFVQIRTPYEDPNLMQFWIQADFGARVNSLDPKVFQMNDGTAVAKSLAGDYSA